MRRKYKSIIIAAYFLFLYSASALSAGLSAGTVRIDINSDFISYDNTKDLLTSSGNVRVLYKNIKLRADRLTYNRNNGEINASGNISFKTDNYSLLSEKIRYNIFSSTGRVFTAKVTAEPLYIYADEIEIRSKTVFFIPRGDLTTCDHSPPHYKFTGKNILVDTESKFRIFNMFMTIRGIPALYSPYYFKTIGPKKSRTDIDVGKSNREGYFVKSKISYPFSQNSRSYIGVDYMSIIGLGLKAGHNYSTARGKLNLGWYYVNEKESLSEARDDKYRKNNKFNLIGWQRIKENFRIRGKAEYVDDREFNYHYIHQVGQEYYQQKVYMQAALEYSKSVYFASLSMDKEEEWENGKYRIKRYILPGLRLRVLPVKLPFNSNFSVNTRYQNKYIRAKENWQPYFNWNTKIVTSHRKDFTKQYFVTLSPDAGYYIRYSADSGVFTHYVSLFTGMRQGLYNKLFFDSDYQWKQEAGKPYKIVTSKLDQKITYRPLRPLRLTTRSSYDFCRENIHSVGEFFSTVNLKLKDFNLFIRNRYDYYDKRNKDWLFEIGIMNYFKSTVKYNYLNPLRLEIAAELKRRIGAFTIESGLQFYSQRSSVKKWDYKFDRFIQKSLNITWDMHCWESNLRFINRGDEYEFWVLFNISAFPETKAGLYGDIISNEEGQIMDTDYRFHRE